MPRTAMVSAASMTMDIDCETMSHLISGRMDEALPPAEAARMRVHFLMCKTCRRVDEQMQFLRRAMQTLDRGPADCFTTTPNVG